MTKFKKWMPVFFTCHTDNYLYILIILLFIRVIIFLKPLERVLEFDINLE